MAIASREATKWVAVLMTAALLIVAPRVASAQSVEAEALFQQGKALLKEGKIAEACEKFDGSDRLEPSVGTELNLADCRERNGQFATAWATFLKAAANAKKAGNDSKREAEARKRALALEPKLSYLTISVPDASKVEGLSVSRNGVPVDQALWNQGVPVDPGEYAITGQAPGHEPWTSTITISDAGQKASVEVPRFKQIEDLVPGEGDGKGDGKGDGNGDPIVPDEPHRVDANHKPGMFTGMRKASIGVAAVGLLAVGGGIVFGLKSADLRGQADVLCPNAACANPDAITLNDDAQSAALTANVMFAVGGVAVAGAVALWFLGAPDEAPTGDDEIGVTPVLGRDSVGLSFAGRF